MNQTYVVIYAESTEATPAQHDAVGQFPREATLEEVRAACRELNVTAVLRDEAGFRRGSVDANGNYRLE